jgi:hypothetical protein
MIIWLAGISCVGKSTIMRDIISKFPEGEKVRPTKYFDCIKFDNFIIIGGRYYRKTSNPGSDYIFAGKDRFKNFMEQEYPKHKNMLIEGQKFFRKEILHWLIDNYELKIYYLSVDINTLDERSTDRGGWWDKKRTDKRTNNEIKKMNNLINDKKISQHLEILQNNTMTDIDNNAKIIERWLVTNKDY